MEDRAPGVLTDDDARPLVLMGASIGGTLALETATRTGRAASVVATCLLDPRDPAVRARLARTPLLGRAAGPVLKAAAGPLTRVRVPIRWIADMDAIANDPGLRREVLLDRRGGGGRVPLGWMRSLLEFTPAVGPEDVTAPPVLLVHPVEDRWTPVALSTALLHRLPSSWTRTVLLEGCGHFPVEEPGFTRLLDAVGELVHELAARTSD